MRATEAGEEDLAAIQEQTRLHGLLQVQLFDCFYATVYWKKKYIYIYNGKALILKKPESPKPDSSIRLEPEFLSALISWSADEGANRQ